MSYCRWSSDDFSCDVYCYESSGGFETHVAGNRVIGDIPKIPSFISSHPDVWLKAHKAQMAFLDTCERKPIGLPCDGMAFTDPDLPSFLSRLESLKQMGYIVPDWVIKSVKQDIKEAT